MADSTMSSSDTTRPRGLLGQRLISGPLAFVGGFIRYSAYMTLYFGVILAILGYIATRPGVKPAVREALTHGAQRVIGVALSTSQDYQMREALRLQLVDLRQTIEKGVLDIRRTSVSHNVAGESTAVGTPVAPLSASMNGAPADVRALPYPYHSYLSIASDPDAMKFSDFEKIHELIHDQYQLNLSDQLFVSNSHGAKEHSGLDIKLGEEKPLPLNLDRFYKLLKAHRHGQVEGIHGWHSGAFASSETSFRLEVASKKATKQVRFSDLKFYDPADQNYIIFEYRMPHAGSNVLVEMGGLYRPVKSQVDQETGMAEAVTWTPMYLEVPHGMVDPEVNFIMTGEPASFLEVRNLMVTNFAQARIAAEARFLNEYNLRFLYYSEHGRIRNELSSGLRVDIHKNSRATALIDNPQQAPNFYLMPYLEQLGVTFINASHHTSQYHALPITSLTDPLRFNDGVVRYNFKRFLSNPKRDDGNFHTTDKDVSWEPWMGFHIDRLLKSSTRIGDGGVIYTHWGNHNPSESGLSEASKQQLAILQERHFNLSGQTPYWKRVWVAPVAETLLFSRAMEGIRDNAVYDSVENVVHIRSWYDPIARQSVPWSKTRAFGLANLTFYVNDASTAKLTIDGRDYTCLKRNPPDHSGRPSITIADDFTPTVAIDEVDPLQKFADVESDGASSYFRQLGGFRGSKCLEMQLENSQGSSTWSFPELTSSFTQSVRMAYRKTNPACRVGMRVLFADGSELEITEAELSANKIGWQILPQRDDKWHDVVCDLAELQAPRPLKRVPRGKVKSLTFFAENAESGDSVFFDAVEFLRSPIHPPSGDRRVLVAGRVEPPREGVKITLDDGTIQQTTETVDGYFFFPQGTIRGSVVKVFAETENKLPHYPLSGRYHDVHQNEVELVIPLDDLRDRGASQNLQKTFKAISELNTEVGRIYKPHTPYVHSGIGTPQEYENKLQINNVGFLDRDRREANPDQSRRVLFLGNCNLFGHSTPRSWHSNVILEDMLIRSTGYPTEVITLADSAMSFGKHWSYYQGLGRKFKPDVVCIFVHTSGVEHLEADPDLFARFYEYAPDHFPGTLFRSQPDGSLKVIEPDPEYFQHIGKDEALHKEREEEKKKGGYYTAGVDWLTIYYRQDWNTLPEPARKAWDHFARVLKHYQTEMAKDGARLMIVMTPEAQRMYGGTMKDFKDAEGFACNTRLLGERMNQLCNDLGVGYFNLTPYIEQNYPDANMYIWRYDAHPSPYGFQMLASGVHDYLLSTNFCELIPGNDPSRADALLAYFNRHATK